MSDTPASIVLPFLHPQPPPSKKTFDLSFGRPENFPIGALPDRIRIPAVEVARNRRLPICLTAMTAIGALSAAFGKGVEVRGAFDKPTRLNLYVIAVAERGIGKGNTGDILLRPLQEASENRAERAKDIHRQARAEMRRLMMQINRAKRRTTLSDAELDDLATKEVRVEELKQLERVKKMLIVQDATSEALIHALAQNGEALLVYSTEAGGIVQVLLGRYTENQTDINIYLCGYSGDPWSNCRVGRDGDSLRCPTISLVLMVQDAVFRRLLADKDTFDRGFTARALSFDSEAQRQKDDGTRVPYTSLEDWKELTFDAVAKRLAVEDDGAEPYVIGCTPEAFEIFLRFNNESIDIEEEYFSDFKGELSRWRENAIKVAGGFAFAEGKSEITKDIAERACRVVRWCSYNYFTMLLSSRRARMAEEINDLKALLRPNGGRMSRSELQTHGFTKARLQKIISAAPEAFLEGAEPQITADGKAARGRPAEFIAIAPSKSPAKS